jgi:hypothetical protein
MVYSGACFETKKASEDAGVTHSAEVYEVLYIRDWRFCQQKSHKMSLAHDMPALLAREMPAFQEAAWGRPEEERRPMQAGRSLVNKSGRLDLLTTHKFLEVSLTYSATARRAASGAMRR